MDESDRVVVLDPRTQVVEERELQVHPGPQGEAAGIHRVLQRDDGEAVQVDVQRKTLSSGLTQEIEKESKANEVVGAYTHPANPV